MSEIRIHKNLVIIVGGIFILLFLLLINNRCDSDANSGGPVNSNMPTIYAITPTYSRPVQKAELTR